MIAQTIMRQLVVLEPDPRAGSALHFFGIPDFHDAAYVYITYFDYAVYQTYGRRDFDVFRHEEDSGDAVRRVLEAWRGGDGVYRWVFDEGRLERLDSENHQ